MRTDVCCEQAQLKKAINEFLPSHITLMVRSQCLVAMKAFGLNSQMSAGTCTTLSTSQQGLSQRASISFSDSKCCRDVSGW